MLWPNVKETGHSGRRLCTHSLTKYFGGHHDLIGGSITATSALVEKIWRTYNLLGISAGIEDPADIIADLTQALQLLES